VVPRARSGRRRAYHAHGEHGPRDHELRPLAQQTVAALRDRKRPSRRVADLNRRPGHTRDGGRRRFLRQRRLEGRRRAVHVRVQDVLRRTRRAFGRSHACRSHLHSLTPSYRTSHLESRALAGVRLVAARRRARSRKRNRCADVVVAAHRRVRRGRRSGDLVACPGGVEAGYSINDV